MPDLSEFIPVRRETLTTIRPRIDADANPGIAPGDSNYIDITPGGFYWDLTQAVLLEIERAWDFASVEVPAVMFLAYAWGEFLDEHGDQLNLERKDEAKATGTIDFVGASGVVIPVGFQVSTAPVDPDQDPVTVATTVSGTIPAGGTITLAAQAVDSGPEGNVAMNTLTEAEVPLDNLTSMSNSAAFSGGVDVEDDEAYRERLLLAFTAVEGAGTVSDYQRWLLARPGVGYVTVEAIWAGPGTVRCTVMDTANNPLSAAAVWDLQNYVDPPSATTTLSGSGSVSVAGATVTVASTTNFAATGAFYVGGQRITYTGKTATTFTGCAGGTGTVLAGTTVFQGGRGLGEAPIGAEVLVVSGTLASITVAATVTHRTGFSLDGTGGTTATRSLITAMVSNYIDGLPPGERVVLNHVRAQFFEVDGVYDVPTLTLNGSAADVATAALQVPTLVLPLTLT